MLSAQLLAIVFLCTVVYTVHFYTDVQWCRLSISVHVYSGVHCQFLYMCTVVYIVTSEIFIETKKLR